MNEFLEQFVAEGRDLVEQATGDLLGLERNPADSALLDGVFRAFHTLKGGAAIVDFHAMERVVHAAEDALSRIRGGEQILTAETVGDCLSCLDQIVQWFDHIEAHDALPLDAHRAANTLAARFTFAIVAHPEQIGEAVWFSDREDFPQARTSIRYHPEARTFIDGEDPIAAFEKLPGLLRLYLAAPVSDGLADYDSFSCVLQIGALSSASAAEVEAFCAGLRGRYQIEEVLGASSAGLDERAKAILEAQIQLLAERGEGAANRVVSAARVASNVLRAIGRTDDAARVDQARTSGDDDSDHLTRLLRSVIEGEAAAPAPSAALEAARVVRVDVDRIESLVKLTGELTVARNAIDHVAKLLRDPATQRDATSLLGQQATDLSRLVDRLQKSVLALRVVPMRQVFQRFPRLVREMAAALEKPTRLEMEGEATEADKAVVEVLFEPLLHVLRNALDHGVEPSADRIAAGKPALATIALRAAREGDRVVVEVQDDGRGVELDRVRRVAAERGIVAADALGAMGDEDVMDLIFAPGFSTAEQISAVSGRGVGMDVVRSAIEKLGGRVRLHSQPKQGTLVRFELPFTVMMTQIMTIEVGGQAFGIPLESVIETVRVPRKKIAGIGAARAFVLRDRTVPILALAEELGVSAAKSSAPEATILVLSINGAVAALEVDGLGERIDVMLKPLDGLLAGTPGVSGTTLLGDGRVLIVLEPAGLMR